VDGRSALDLLAGLFRLWNRIGVAGKLHDIAFDRPDKLKVDVVMVALVPGAAVFPGELDPLALNAIDSPD